MEAGDAGAAQLRAHTTLSPAEVQTISAVAYVLGPLSLLGSAFVCACYVLLRSKRTFGFQLVFLLSINDVCSQLRIIVQLFRVGAQGDLSHSLCVVQAYLTSYFELACVLWTCAVAFTLHLTVLRQNDLAHVASLFPRIVLFCQGLPAVACIAAQAAGVYGEAGAWCWIVEHGALSGALRFATFYVPLWLAIIYNLVIFTKVRVVINRAVQLDMRATAQLPSPAASAAASSRRRTPAPPFAQSPPPAAWPSGGAQQQQPDVRSAGAWAQRLDFDSDGEREGSSLLRSAAYSDDPRLASGGPYYTLPPSPPLPSHPGPRAARQHTRSWGSPPLSDGPPSGGDGGGGGDADGEGDDDGDNARVIEDARDRVDTEQQEQLLRAALRRQRKARLLSKRLLIYPLILVVCWTFATLNRTQNLVSSDDVFALWLLHTVFASLQGFFNSIAYGLTDGVREALGAAWRRMATRLGCCCCCGGSRTPDYEEAGGELVP